MDRATPVAHVRYKGPTTPSGSLPASGEAVILTVRFDLRVKSRSIWWGLSPLGPRHSRSAHLS
jgi:hypothetical protein